MNHFRQERYAEAAEHARETVTGNPRLPFYWLLLAASLKHDNREDEARRLMREFRSRFPEFATPTVRDMWQGGSHTFSAGRERLILAVDALERR